jgi:hypothetical protein
MVINRERVALIDIVENEIAEFTEKLSEKMEKASNPHEQQDVIAEIVELMLAKVDLEMPKEPYRNINNTPKHLIHMTDEDLQPKPPAVMKEELQELIKEARSKIKPVQMSRGDQDRYIKPAEDFEKMHDGWKLRKIDGRGMKLLDDEGISLEILRKIQDKKYEIDLDYERTRDLFEKQRVVDQFLEEHQEDNMILHGYYQNKYHKSEMNKFIKFIYSNSYDLSTVRFNFYASTLSTVLATVALGMVHPALCGIMLYDYYLLGAFSTQFLNRTVHRFILDNDKHNVLLNKVNFLGFETQKAYQVQIRDIKYMGELKNDYLSFENTGLPPSFNKLM